MKKKQAPLSASEMMKQLSANIKPKREQTLVEWIVENKIKTEDGLPFDFTKRKFLIDFYNDLSPQQAIRASSQLGKTVGMYVKCLYLGMEKKINILFSEPTQKLRDDLTKSKLNRLIEVNPIFRNNVSGDMNVKMVKNNVMFLEYTHGAGGGIGVTADLYVGDEVARSNPEKVDMFKSRLANSDYRWLWWISNPWLPSDLLDQKWQESDQLHWVIKCQSCARRQILNWDGLYGFKGNVCKERKIRVCQYCDKELSVESIIDGEWVKRFENRDIRGYWMHQLMRFNADIKDMIRDESKNMAYFKNMVMGEPYSGSSIVVDHQLFKTNLAEVPRQKPVTNIVAGIDTGFISGHHIVLMDASTNTVFKLFKAKDFEEIENVLIDYGVEQWVIDSKPEYENAKRLQQNFPNMGMRCHYITSSTKDEVQYYDEDKGMVYIHRHIMFDNIINDLGAGKYKFAFRDNDKTFNEFCDHAATMSKIPDFDAAGNPIFKWTAPEHAADHYFHAMLYAVAAAQRLEEMRPNGYTYNADDAQFENQYEPQNAQITQTISNDWYNL